jgi:hypothetical protein
MTRRSRMAAVTAAAAALALPVASVAAPAASARPEAVAAGCVKAKVGGASKCLAAGQACSHKYQKTYAKHGFSCVKSHGRYRLVANKLSF